MDGQVTEGDRMFAIWCTVVDRFETVNGQQAWESAEELDADLTEHERVTGEDMEWRQRLMRLAGAAGY